MAEPDFQLLFEQCPGLHLVLAPNREFTIVAVTDAYLRAVMRSREALLGRGLFEALPDNPADPRATGVSNLRASLERVIATKAPDRMAVQKYDVQRPVDRGGSFEERYWSPINIPILSSTGELRYILHQVEDVTDLVRPGGRREVEATLQHRAWLQSLFMQAPMAIAILRGSQYVVELANPPMCRVWRRPPEQLLGRPLFEALPEAAGQGFEQLLASVLASGTPYVGKEMHAQLPRPEGGPPEDVYLNFVYEPLRGSDGRVEGVIAVAFEVTEQVEARKRAEALAATLQVKEERLRLATEAAGVGIWELDLETFQAWRSELHDRAFGLETMLPEWSFERFLTYVHPDDRERVSRTMKAAMEAQGSFSQEFRVFWPDGSLHWMAARGAVKVDAQGRARKMVGTNLDITAARRAEQELYEGEQRFRAVVASLSEGITLQDAKGVLRLTNKSAERHLGLSFDQMAGRTSFDPRWRAVGEDGQPLAGQDHPAMLALRTRQPITGLVMGIHRPDGTLVWLSVNSQPIFEQDGETLAGVVSSFFDITEQKRADEERERLLKQLGEAVRLRDEFLSIASHELNTPLTSLSLKLQTLTRAADANPQAGSTPLLRRDIELMRRQVHRLAALVNDLLDVSRISTGRMRLTLEPVDLSELLHEVVSRFEPEAARAGCRLEVRVAPSVVGHWDRGRLEQVISNLLSNALKYGAGQPVRISMEPVGERVRLVVQDQGIGISPEAIHRIFEKFERDVSDRHYGGLGLGLYVTRQIVEAFRGEIRVESAPARGATFTVELPRSIPA
jgi:hypothetical protein